MLKDLFANSASFAVKSFFDPENWAKLSSLPARFGGRKSNSAVVKSVLVKDALSCWNFSNLWPICRHQEGYRRTYSFQRFRDTENVCAARSVGSPQF